jgi:hypothetical protein
LRVFVRFVSSVIVLIALCCPAAIAHAGEVPNPAATAINSSTIPAPLTTPMIVRLSLDPPASDDGGKCVEDGMLHLRNGRILICAEGTWQAADFSR